MSETVENLVTGIVAILVLMPLVLPIISTTLEKRDQSRREAGRTIEQNMEQMARRILEGVLKLYGWKALTPFTAMQAETDVPLGHLLVVLEGEYDSLGSAEERRASIHRSLRGKTADTTQWTRDLVLNVSAFRMGHLPEPEHRMMEDVLKQLLERAILATGFPTCDDVPPLLIELPVPEIATSRHARMDAMAGIRTTLVQAGVPGKAADDLMETFILGMKAQVGPEAAALIENG